MIQRNASLIALLLALPAGTLSVGAWASEAAPAAAAARVHGKVKNGGTLGNSFAGSVLRVNDDTMRVTARKRVAGSMEEINTPGTTAAQALESVNSAAALRAAIEAKALGYNAFELLSTRNVSREQAVQRRGTGSGGQASESGYVSAPGQYKDDVEIGLEVTVRLRDMPADSPLPDKYYDVGKILASNGIKTD